MKIKFKNLALLALGLISLFLQPECFADQSVPKPINMIFVGETGAGKSSIINMIYNASHSIEAKDIKLFPAPIVKGNHVFFNPELHPDENFDANKIIESSSQSQTEKIEVYPVKFSDHKINLIDTPGFNDTKGEENHKILEFVYEALETYEINAICFVIKSSDNRISQGHIEMVEKLKKAIFSNGYKSFMRIIVTGHEANGEYENSTTLLKKLDIDFNSEHLYGYNSGLLTLDPKTSPDFESRWGDNQIEIARLIASLSEETLVSDRLNSFRQAKRDLETSFNSLKAIQPVENQLKKQVVDLFSFLKALDKEPKKTFWQEQSLDFSPEKSSEKSKVYRSLNPCHAELYTNKLLAQATRFDEIKKYLENHKKTEKKRKIAMTRLQGALLDIEEFGYNDEPLDYVDTFLTAQEEDLFVNEFRGLCRMFAQEHIVEDLSEEKIEEKITRLRRDPSLVEKESFDHLRMIVDASSVKNKAEMTKVCFDINTIINEEAEAIEAHESALRKETKCQPTKLKSSTLLDNHKISFEDKKRKAKGIFKIMFVGGVVISCNILLPGTAIPALGSLAGVLMEAYDDLKTKG